VLTNIPFYLLFSKINFRWLARTGRGVKAPF